MRPGAVRHRVAASDAASSGTPAYAFAWITRENVNDIKFIPARLARVARIPAFPFIYMEIRSFLAHARDITFSWPFARERCFVL